MSDIAKRYVEALAAKDTKVLLDLFANEVDFKGITPFEFWTASSPEAVVHDVLYHWFEPKDQVTAIESLQPGTVVDRQSVSYRFLVTCPDGRFAVEQHAYFDVDESDRITSMQAVCAGYRQIDAN